MKRSLSFISFIFLTFISATSCLAVNAGGCSSHKNKAVEIKCDKDDTECQAEKSERFDLKAAIKS